MWGAGVASFPKADLPESTKGLTVLSWIKAKEPGKYQEILSWGTADKTKGCVSLHITADGGLEYGELPATGSMQVGKWANITADLTGIHLFSNKWHSIAVSRSPLAVAYLYMDGRKVGQGILQAPRPSQGLGDAKAARTCGPTSSVGDSKFEGEIRGLRIYERALTTEQVSWAEAPGGTSGESNQKK